MLVKYLGAEYDQDSRQWIPRSQFLENGLFRMTQPRFLNDKGSEARFYPYFDEFSPSDLAYARRKHRAFSCDPSSNYISDEELAQFYLKPTGRTYDPETFPTLLGFTEYSSIEEYKEAKRKELELSVYRFNKFIVESLSCNLGVFSLSTDNNNELMWTHYANEGKGLVVQFKESHAFFQKFVPQSVSYEPEDRATITNYKGIIRINGELVDSFKIGDEIKQSDIFTFFNKNTSRYEDLIQRLLYSKSKKWSYEEEKRIICPLSYCEKKLGEFITPDFDIETPKSLQNFFSKYQEIQLKSIPFEAIEAITFGYGVNEIQKEYIIKKAKNNPKLDHLLFNQATINIFGDIVVEKII